MEAGASAAGCQDVVGAASSVIRVPRVPAGGPDDRLELEPILQGLAQLPALDLAYGEDTPAELPAVVGGLSVALAPSFKIVDPTLRHPQTKHWDMAFALFDLLL
jgi:hypothetical protein